MARLGHSTPRAALIYQHAAVERDHEIADRVSTLSSKPRNRRRWRPFSIHARDGREMPSS
jgi:hypothetical protein